MAHENTTRRLAAIVAADIVGYSRLMAADEEGTLSRLRALRADLIDPALARAGGRIVKTTGDGLLIEFASSVDAVRCCVAVQREMVAHEAARPEVERIRFRVGINLGDIMVDGDDIHGDGVNIAARLEALAEPGGITISDRVYADLRGKLDVGFEDQGAQRLKNIPEPVRIYRIALDGTGVVATRRARVLSRRIAAAAVVALAIAAAVLWWRPWLERVEAADPAAMAYALPVRPSIAVLPFDDLSGAGDRAHIADGLTESIISALASVPQMFVIARNSSFTYKGKAVKVRRVAEDLGVRYVLEGSVRHAGDRLRVTAQLIDAIAGHHVWVASYDRTLADLFEVQDEISLNIATALQVELTEGEMAALSRGRTQDLEAWRLDVEAEALFRRTNPTDNAAARKLWQEAVARDPDFANAWVGLGSAHWIDARFGWTASRDVSLNAAKAAAAQAIALHGDNPRLHSLLGLIHLLEGDYDGALDSGRRAIELAPSVADSHALLAVSAHFAGDFSEALALIREAKRLHPHHPSWYNYRLGSILMMLDKHEAAIAALGAWARPKPDQPERKVSLAAAHSLAGRDAEARRLVSEVLAARPHLNLKTYAKAHPFRNPAHLERLLDALRRAGYPEG